MQGGKHSAAAYTELEKFAFGSCVASLASFVVSAGTGMNLNISTGAGLISDTIARRIGTDAVETATVPTASASFGRIDTVVAYIDTAVSPTTAVTDNTNDILKFVVVAGTAASTPVAPTGAAIVTAIGAGKPYMVLYDVLVPQNATNTSGMTLTDRRVLLTAPTVADNAIIAAKIAALAVTTAKIDNLAVTTAKINDNAVTNTKLSTSAIKLGYAQITSNFTTTTNSLVTGLSVAITMPAGGRSIKITAFSLALSNSSSPTNSDMTIEENGTEIARCRVTSGGANYCSPGTAYAVRTPASGASVTYTVRLYNVGGATAQLQATSTSPCFLLVEAI